MAAVLLERWRGWTATEPVTGPRAPRASSPVPGAGDTHGTARCSAVGRLGLGSDTRTSGCCEPLPEDFSLRQRGEVFLALSHRRVTSSMPFLSMTPSLTSEQLADIIGGDPASLRVLSSERLMLPNLSIYDPGTMHCPTNLTNRYLDTAVEAVLWRQVWERVPPGEVVSLHAEGMHRWAVTLRVQRFAAEHARVSWWRWTWQRAAGTSTSRSTAISCEIAYNGGWHWS